jgi:hypothetical protein
MPKLNFAAATTWFSKPSRPGRSAQEAHAELTRSRGATRRLSPLLGDPPRRKPWGFPLGEPRNHEPGVRVVVANAE